MLETLQFLDRSKPEEREGRRFAVRLSASSLVPKLSVICHTRSQPWWYGHHPPGSRMQQRTHENISTKKRDLRKNKENFVSSLPTPFRCVAPRRTRRWRPIFPSCMLANSSAGEVIFGKKLFVLVVFVFVELNVWALQLVTLLLWGRCGNRRRRYSLSRRCASCVAWWSGCRAQCAPLGAWGRRSGRGWWRTERSRNEGRWSQRETHIDDYADDMRFKNTLSHEVRVTQTSRGVTKLRALSASSQVGQLARVGVRVLVVDVVSVILVLIARVYVHAVSTQFSWPVFCSWRCTLYNLQKSVPDGFGWTQTHQIHPKEEVNQRSVAHKPQQRQRKIAGHQTGDSCLGVSKK